MRRLWIAGVLVVGLIGCAPPINPTDVLNTAPPAASITITATYTPLPGKRIDEPIFQASASQTTFVSQGWSPSGKWVWHETVDRIYFRDLVHGIRYDVRKDEFDARSTTPIWVWLPDDRVLMIAPVCGQSMVNFCDTPPTLNGENVTGIRAISQRFSELVVLISDNYSALYEKDTQTVLEIADRYNSWPHESLILLPIPDVPEGWEHGFYSPDRTMLLLSGGSGFALYHLSSQEVQPLPIPSANVIWHPDSRMLIAALNSSIAAYDLNGALLGEWWVESRSILHIQANEPFSPDASKMLAVDRDGAVYIIPMPALP